MNFTRHEAGFCCKGEQSNSASVPIALRAATHADVPLNAAPAPHVGQSKLGWGFGMDGLPPTP